MKHITIVSGSISTSRTLRDQLGHYIDVSNVKLEAIESKITSPLDDDLIIYSSQLAYNELFEAGLVKLNTDYIIAKRTINFNNLSHLVELAPNTSVLLVNDHLHTAKEVIEHLNDIGLDHIIYSPYIPGMPILPVDIAITPGEVDKVPNSIDRVIDIGPRIMDFSTVTRILLKLGVLDQKAGQFSQSYLETIIQVSKNLSKSKKTIAQLNTQLKGVLDGLADGLLVYSKSFEISFMNEYMQNKFALKHVKYDNRSLYELFGKHEIVDFLKSNKRNSGVFNINSNRLVVRKIQIDDDSIIATFKAESTTIDDNDLLRKELKRKGLYGKYSLKDIIGESDAIKKVKSVTEKLAKSNLTILIEGESGTGKELFASAIHNASLRKTGPFLPVNFSALTDELVESELFGYEEGAFTGAKKGGKIGLFEQANSGTIFIDEVGDISLKLQTRLLRVLQENEILRIGGDEIKSIDVRVVAATNKDLYRMVREGTFREDLYYRLKMGYIKLPPLRNRKVDIPLLANHFIENKGLQHYCISDELINLLSSYDWLGNIRELKNTIDYMLAVTEGEILDVNDLPDQAFFHKEPKDEPFMATTPAITEEDQFLLNLIKEFNDKRELCGREKLAIRSIGSRFEMTKYQIRNRLNHLESSGLITKKKGKIGTALTETGLNHLKPKHH